MLRSEQMMQEIQENLSESDQANMRKRYFKLPESKRCGIDEFMISEIKRIKQKLIM